MAVQNIECQIALGQMSRYLSGDALAADVEDELKAHIARCSSCASALEHRRVLLQAMLGANVAVAPEHSPDAEEPSETPRGNGRAKARLGKNLFAEAVVRSARDNTNAGDEPALSPPTATHTPYWKALAYSAALALVMVAMSFLMRDPTRLFGERAIADAEVATPANAIPAEPQEPITPPAEFPAPRAPSLAAAPTQPVESAQQGSQGSKVTIAKSETPKTPATSRPSPEPETRKTALPKRRLPARSGGTGTLRLYDANGNPISP